MGTRQLPDMPKKMMDRNHLASLIQKAMAAFTVFLRKQSFGTETVEVYRPCSETGKTFQSLSRPRLYDVLSAGYSERVQIPEGKSLFDYLWEHGGHSIQLSQEKGNPDRAGWERSAFGSIIATPLKRFWDERSIRSLSSTGEWKPWDISDSELRQLADRMASIVVGKGAEVKVTIPLLQLSIKDTTEFKLEENVTIKSWSQEDKALYLFKNDYVYPFDIEFAPYSSKCYIEIVINESQVFKSGRNQELFEDFISFILGRVKWAIMQTTDPTKLIRELPVTTEIYCEMGSISPIRRQTIPKSLRGSSSLDLNRCNDAAELLMLSKALDAFPELKDVIWLFDRAMLAGLPRDVLLESAIGLERLLVAGGGETSRRFRNYGAALIGGKKRDETLEYLKKIYSARSKAAHGGDVKPNEFEEISVRARSYLSKAIANVVRLVVSEKIRPNNKEDINKAIERYLLSLMYDAVEKDLP